MIDAELAYFQGKQLCQLHFCLSHGINYNTNSFES